MARIFEHVRGGLINWHSTGTMAIVRHMARMKRKRIKFIILAHKNVFLWYKFKGSVK